MSNRTKSFFEQDHNKPKSRPGQWRQQNRTPLNETSSNIAPQKPPIPATSQAKSKLKAFQFVPGRPGDSGQEPSEKPSEPETNDTTLEDAPEPPTVNKASTAENNVGSGNSNGRRPSSVPSLPHAHTFPCTPITRLPLEDLIGNYDETAQNSEPQEQTPEEQLGWDPGSSKKRKRARSSSPSCPNTSSQRQETSAFFAETTLAEKKTPEADPSADLWQRYGTMKHGDGEAKMPDFAHLIFQASPRALETPAKTSGLKRWSSTGNDFPSSKNKRMRTNVSARVNLWQDEQMAEVEGKSKVAAMVEKLQESLATQRLANPPPKPAVRIEGPSSSSPLPEVGAADDLRKEPAPSPLQTKQQNIVTTADKPEVCPVPQRPGFGHTNGNDVQRPYHAPDSVISAPLHLQSKARLPAYKRPSVTRTPSNSNQQKQTQPPPVQPVQAVAIANDLDEFADDLELTAEDLDELITQPLHQRPLHQISPHPNPPSQQNFDLELRERPANGVQLAGGAEKAINVDDDDDEFGCDDIDEASLAQVEMNATQAFRTSPRKRSPRKARSPKKTRSPVKSPLKSSEELPRDFKRLQRYVVKQIVDGEYTNTKGRQCPEKLLMAEDNRTGRAAAITLRDSWINTSIAIGNVVHVAHIHQSQQQAPPSSPPGQITISDAEGSPLLIIHPDHMLSATTIADSFDCIRKAVLQDRIKATNDTSKALAYGKILHEVFQQALSANRWDDSFLVELVERTVQNHVEILWELGMQNTLLAVEEIKAKMGELASWARIFVAKNPSEVALVDDKQGEKVWMSISKLIAIEEHIWSPQYGLKGNIDATVQTTLIDHPNEPSKKLIVPFEVKTGKTSQSAAHRAQTALYTLLLSDRYDVSVKAGILYYLESSSMSRIAPPTVEIRQMIQQRNRLASYIHRAKHPAAGQEVEEGVALPTQEIEESGLPALLKNSYKCGRCYAQQSCFTYHALVENGSAMSAGMVDDGKKNHALVWQEAVGHLQLSAKDQSQAQELKRWFSKWDRLLTFEEKEASRMRQELWTMDSLEREKAGRCFGNLVIKKDLTSTASDLSSSVVDGIEGAGNKISRFAYTFTRSTSKPGQSFAEGTQLTIGEPVVVSSESGQWALANGYVIAATKTDITVAVDRRLGDARQRLAHFNDDRDQAFRGIMTVGEDQAPGPLANEQRILFRLDKDEFSNGLALVRNNLVTLMSSHPIHAKLRNQIIFNAEPSFVTTSQIPSLPPSQLGEMNEDQRAAVSKILNAQDYALVLGMPGTGKTTIIAHIIRALLVEQKSILLTSFTHTAVDNILLKIHDVAPKGSIVRLGTLAKINPQVQQFCQLAASPRTSIEEIEEAYMGCQIVASTCMGTNHPLFNRRAFDVCIVDEASQITLPTSLGPLLHARKFVLVGDHYQLPPLVQNKAALEGGLDVSLFRQLSEQHPNAVATLGKQYRMCEDIMTLSNTLIYNGQLRCGSDAVANRTLHLPNPTALSRFHTSHDTCSTPSNGGICWLTSLTTPNRKVIFANTDLSGATATETLSSGRNITNHFEATLTLHLVTSLLALGVPGTEIGIVTLYRSQLALIRRLFKTAGIPPEVEIDSADRFQGRDKECIIISMVRSNEGGIVGGLLEDWRRVNVALTRARSKLVVFGSRGTLGKNELLARLLALVDERGWAADLPKGADGLHDFNLGSQAASEAMSQTASTPTKVQQAAKSPRKPAPTGTPSTRILKESISAGNRSPVKVAGLAKQPAKVISSRGMVQSTPKSRRALEQVAMEIWEDLDEDDF